MTLHCDSTTILPTLDRLKSEGWWCARMEVKKSKYTLHCHRETNTETITKTLDGQMALDNIDTDETNSSPANPGLRQEPAEARAPEHEGQSEPTH